MAQVFSVISIRRSGKSVSTTRDNCWRKTSAYRLAEAATDPVYLERVRRIDESFTVVHGCDTLLAPIGDTMITPEHPVAYFCAEFGVHTFVAALFRWTGHTRGRSSQVCERSWSAAGRGRSALSLWLFSPASAHDGWQEEHYGETFPNELPIHLVKNADDAPLRIEVLIRDRKVLAQVWRADVGRCRFIFSIQTFPRTWKPIAG